MHAKNYTHLYVIGLAIQPNATQLVDSSLNVMRVPATCVPMTPDAMMGDLLKNMRSSEIVSVCGLPDVSVRTPPKKGKNDPQLYQVELSGLDVCDPITMKADHRAGNDVPAWFLDTNYNELSFHADQAFFPRTSAWEGLRKALRSSHDESVWDHLAGTVNAPFEAGDRRKIAVKVIDDRGAELMVVWELE